MILSNDFSIWILPIIIFLVLMEINGIPRVVQEDKFKDETSNTNFKKEIHFVSKRSASSFRSERYRESDVVFFEQEEITVPKFTPNFGRSEPKCAKGLTFCTEVDGYPEEYIETILKRDAKKYEALFGEDLVVPEEIQNRFSNGVDEEESLCTSSEELVYPKAGETNDGSWNLIINNQNYTQGVRIEKCSPPDVSCKMANNFPNGYQTRCKQNYIFRQLLSFDDSGSTVKKLFKLPSCCECVLIRTNSRK